MSSPADSHSFMGMPKFMNYQDVSSFAAHLPTANQPSLTFTKWWPMYARALFIFARTHNSNEPQNVEAMQIFFINLSQLLPNAKYSAGMQDFLQMKPHVIDTLVKTVPNVFSAYPWLETSLRRDPKVFTETAMKNSDSQSLMLYVYLLNAYMVAMYNKENIRSPLRIPTLNEQRTLYQLDRISKSDWGNAIWFILHTTALYAPDPMEVSFVRYRNLLSSLRFLLPCPVCRQHLTDNLSKLDFASCGRTREELFRCSWILHNIVNMSENKPVVGLQEAFAIYTL